MTDARRLVDKLWSYCDVLRDDGVGVIEYTEQLTYLLFLKMAHERATRPLRPQQIVPAEFSWQRLLDAQGDRLEAEYTRILIGLARERGVMGTIFRKAQEPHPRPGQTTSPHRRSHRQGELVAVGHRHQGRCLRGVALQRRV